MHFTQPNYICLHRKTYIFQITVDNKGLSVAEYGLLVDLNFAGNFCYRSIHKFKAEGTVKVVLITTPDVTKWNLLQNEINKR